MFTTFVMACSMLTGQCIIAEDDWGPYFTEVQCEQRASMMVQDISEALGTPHTYSLKCEEEKGV